jgi:protein arginine kinase
MQIIDLLYKNVNWLNPEGEYSDVVISSRVRLARNLYEFPFRHLAVQSQEKKIEKILKNVFEKNNYLKNSNFFDIKKLDPVERYFLVERNLISKEHAEYEGERAVIISDKETLSVMLNEEDHVRMHVLFPGFQLMECWRLINKLDTEVQKDIKFAFSKELGYLTACPTNVGTGMRASVMMHLPCLVLTDQKNNVFEAISKLGLTVRGLYGEGTAAIGGFFQISNQITLGLKEEEIIDNIEKVVRQIINYELNARKRLYEREKEKLKDKIWRAYGLLKNVRMISFRETIELLSFIRLGVSLGLLKDMNKSKINELFILAQPAHIQLLENKKLSPEQRDMRRAQLIREKLK